MALITEMAIVILLLAGILILTVKIYLRIKTPERQSFVLQKHCNKNELLQSCKKKGLTDYDTDLLCAKYADCLNSAQLEIKYKQSIRNIQRLVKKAEIKFNS